MDAKLAAIKDAWEGRPAAGAASSDPEGVSLKEDDKVRTLADKYVADHKSEFAGYENLSQGLLVKQLEEYRETGDEDGEWKIQAWLFHHFEPQNVGGPAEAKIRIPNG